MAEPAGLVGQLAAMQARWSATWPAQASEQEYAALLAEVRALSDCISRARVDLAALGAEDILRKHVPAATDELDAIVTHTAAATGTILDVCEELEQLVAGTLAQPTVNAAAARIYEACSFQDITGQRVAKVVQTLLLVESRVAGMLRVFGRAASSDGPRQRSDTLLNGPQRPKDAMDQGAVDALLETLP